MSINPCADAEGDALHVQAGKGGRPKKTDSIKQWPKGELKTLEDRLVSLGRNHDSDLAVEVCAAALLASSQCLLSSYRSDDTQLKPRSHNLLITLCRLPSLSDNVCILANAIDDCIVMPDSRDPNNLDNL